MLSEAANDIVIDARNGAVTGASVGERAAIALLRTSATTLKSMRNFGFSYIARGVRKVLPSDRSMLFVLSDDSRMRVDYCDPYWSVLTSPHYPYEAAIRVLLFAVKDVSYGFIDGGSNHGYWSIIVSGRDAEAKKVVSVEAASDTFAKLDANCRINGDRFVALNKAIGPKSGERVQVYGAKHEGRSTVAPSADAKPILDCETISLDDLAALPVFEGIDKFIVKLDVEGIEIPAFDGAHGLLDRDTVFIYEDHGSDLTHENTRHVLSVLKLRVFWLGEGGAREIGAAAELGEIKKWRRAGYDLVATRSPFWLERLTQLAGGKQRQ